MKKTNAHWSKRRHRLLKAFMHLGILSRKFNRLNKEDRRLEISIANWHHKSTALKLIFD